MTGLALPLESWSDAPRTVLGELFDRIALRGVGFLMANTLWPPAADWETIRSAAQPYLSEELRRRPRKFFACLDERPEYALRVHGRCRIPGGQIVSRELRAPYEPFHRTPEWRDWCENETLPIEHWVHRPRHARATVIALHGLGMGHPRLNAHGLMAQQWFNAGLDVVIPTLPFHGTRTPATARYSGELFVSWNPARLNEAVRRAIFDLHVVHAWLASRDDAAVGLFGLSLGGYLSALMAGLASWPAFVIPMLAPVCIGSVAIGMCGGEPGSAPFSLEEIRRVHRIHSPLTYPLAVPRERALVVGSRGDRVVRPEHAHALGEHWGKPSIHWVSGSHTALFRRPRLMSRLVAHVRRLGVLDDHATSIPRDPGRGVVVPFAPRSAGPRPVTRHRTLARPGTREVHLRDARS